MVEKRDQRKNPGIRGVDRVIRGNPGMGRKAHFGVRVFVYPNISITSLKSRSTNMAQQQLICSACGHVGKPKSSVKGSILIEIFLWFLLLVPGIIYSVWRLTTRHKACAKCGSSNLIPVDSPVGKKLLADQGVSSETPAK